MTANLYQGTGNYVSVVGKNPHGKLPHPPIQSLKEGSEGPTMSDLQFMLHNERKQHEDTYRYEHGSHSGENVPLGESSF